LQPRIMREEELLADASESKYNYIRARELALRQRGVDLLPNEEAPVMRPLDQLLDLPPPFSEQPAGTRH